MFSKGISPPVSRGAQEFAPPADRAGGNRKLPQGGDRSGAGPSHPTAAMETPPARNARIMAGLPHRWQESSRAMNHMNNQLTKLSNRQIATVDSQPDSISHGTSGPSHSLDSLSETTMVALRWSLVMRNTYERRQDNFVKRRDARRNFLAICWPWRKNSKRERQR